MLSATNIDALNAILKRLQRGEHHKEIAALIGCKAQQLGACLGVLRQIGVDVPKGIQGFARVKHDMERELEELRRFKAQHERASALAGNGSYTDTPRLSV